MYKTFSQWKAIRSKEYAASSETQLQNQAPGGCIFVPVVSYKMLGGGEIGSALSHNTHQMEIIKTDIKSLILTIFPKK